MKRNRRTYGTPLFSPFSRVSSFDLHLDPNAIWERRECLSAERMPEQSKAAALSWRRLPRADESQGCTRSRFDGGTFVSTVDPPGLDPRRHMLLAHTVQERGRGTCRSRWPTLMLTLAIAAKMSRSFRKRFIGSHVSTGQIFVRIWRRDHNPQHLEPVSIAFSTNTVNG